MFTVIPLLAGSLFFGVMVWSVTLAVRDWFRKTPASPSIDGFGQSAEDDVLFAKRFRQCKKRQVVWRRPSSEEAARWEAHPVVSRFGLDTDAIAEVDGRQWILRSRMWHGWPDPPEWAFFALEGDAIWAVADFDWMPRRWTLPDRAT